MKWSDIKLWIEMGLAVFVWPVLCLIIPAAVLMIGIKLLMMMFKFIF